MAVQFEIYGDFEEVDRTVRLRLSNHCGDIHLSAVNRHGVTLPGGTILIVNSAGIHLNSTMSDAVPIKKDKLGRPYVHR